MPTDGTFALETLPRNKRHLLTSLSIFFSFGSVLAALVALLVVPQNTCFPEEKLPNRPCDKQKDNNGWKYLFLVCTLIVRPLLTHRIPSPFNLLDCGNVSRTSSLLPLS